MNIESTKPKPSPSHTSNRPYFENFKSTICHRLKQMGDLSFIESVLQSNKIRTYWDLRWYPECLYLLGMLDYVCRVNDVPICSDYDDLRCRRLKEPIYPAGIRAMYIVSGDEEVLRHAKEKSIPEFMRFNIVENNVRDVV